MRYAAFLRGINVGGKHKVKMADLQRLFLDCGFRGVQTVIQSGNVLFETEQAPGPLPGIISGAFETRFGFPSDVVVRSAADVAAVLAALPFSQEEIARAKAAVPDVGHMYIYLSSEPVDPAAAETLQAVCGGEDRLAAGKRELYLLCARSIRDSRLAAALLKLGAPLIARSMKTMEKILTMLKPGKPE